MTTLIDDQRHAYWHNDSEVYANLRALNLLEAGEHVEHNDAVVMLVARQSMPCAGFSSKERLLLAQAFVVCYNEQMLRTAAVPANEFTFMRTRARAQGRTASEVDLLLGALRSTAYSYVNARIAEDRALAYVYGATTASIALEWLLSYDLCRPDHEPFQRKPREVQPVLQELISIMVEWSAGDPIVEEFAWSL